MSDDLEMRLLALDERIARTQAEVNACLQELLTNDKHAHLVAERLPRLGSAALPGLREIMLDASHTEAIRVLAALVGFSVGDRQESLALLIEEVTRNGEFGPLAAARLGEGQIRELEPALLAALAVTATSEIDTIVSYLEALHIVGGRLPVAERERLAGGGAWQVTTAVSQWHAK